MEDYRYIRQDSELREYLKQLRDRGVSILAVDLEGEYNLHRYGEHLCLIQIFDGEEFVLIDPMEMDINIIRLFFEDRKILKVFYDCSGDRTLLFRRYSIHLSGVMDLMPAVELLDFPKKNLNAVLSQVLGIENKSSKKFQRYNWMRRPIKQDALLYALEDVKYLLDLKEKLFNRLIENNLLDGYILKNMDVQTRSITKESIPGVFKKDRFKKMPKESQKLFKQFFSIRDGFAKKLDVPANDIVSNENLFRLSQGEISLDQVKLHPRLSRERAESLKEQYRDLLRT